VPTTTPGARGTDPFEQARLAARELARHAGTEHHPVLVVLGTGLSQVAPLLGAADRPIDLSALPWSSRFTALGHRPEAWSLEVAGSRLLVVSGRLHLYEGRTPAEVVHVVRTALATGCRTVVLTCSAGGINPAYRTGQVVAVADHLNLTGSSPLTGIPAGHAAGSPYADLTDAWSSELRDLARQVEPTLAEGVYAQLPGPQLETPAEVRMLAGLGADLVGMSMVPEAIAARHLGAAVLGLAVVTNVTGGAHVTADMRAEGGQRDPVTAIVETAQGAAGDVARLIEGVVARLPERSPSTP
jgi:purine-nucleoside phosphorylase